MNALDSPLEALAFNYLSYGFLTAVNSLWAWIAVVTAAVSLWKIRAQSTPSIVQAQLSIDSAQSSIDSAQSSIDSAQSSIDSARSSSDSARSSIDSADFSIDSADFSILKSPIKIEKKCLSIASNTTSFGYLERECSTKVKFSLHYDNEDDDVFEEYCDEDESDGGDEKLGWCGGDWERMRMGDLGWYTCQDLTVLNGSVVRLWEGARRRQIA